MNWKKQIVSSKSLLIAATLDGLTPAIVMDEAFKFALDESKKDDDSAIPEFKNSPFLNNTKNVKFKVDILRQPAHRKTAYGEYHNIFRRSLHWLWLTSCGTTPYAMQHALTRR